MDQFLDPVFNFLKKPVKNRSRADFYSQQ